MEVRRAADAILRCNASSPLTTFLTPSLTLTSRCSRAAIISNRRALSTSVSKQAISRPQTKTFTASSTPPKGTTIRPESVDSLAKSLNWTSASSNEAQRRALAMDGGNSATDLLSAINAKRNTRRTSRDFDISRMMDPSTTRTPGSNSTSTRDLMNDISALGLMDPPKPAKMPMRLNPTTGRSVTLAGNIDLGRAIRLMEQNCSRNRVRGDFTRQRFHERGGLKRKRLRRQGWRKRFAEGFSAVVGRVKQLTKQGW